MESDAQSYMVAYFSCNRFYFRYMYTSKINSNSKHVSIHKHTIEILRIRL